MCVLHFGHMCLVNVAQLESVHIFFISLCDAVLDNWFWWPRCFEFFHILSGIFSRNILAEKHAHVIVHIVFTTYTACQNVCHYNLCNLPTVVFLWSSYYDFLCTRRYTSIKLITQYAGCAKKSWPTSTAVIFQSPTPHLEKRPFFQSLHPRTSNVK